MTRFDCHQCRVISEAEYRVFPPMCPHCGSRDVRVSVLIEDIPDELWPGIDNGACHEDLGTF
jgi:hypothetical protein